MQVSCVLVWIFLGRLLWKLLHFMHCQIVSLQIEFVCNIVFFLFERVLENHYSARLLLIQSLLSLIFWTHVFSVNLLITDKNVLQKHFFTNVGDKQLELESLASFKSISPDTNILLWKYCRTSNDLLTTSIWKGSETRHVEKREEWEQPPILTCEWVIFPRRDFWNQ